jgi:two-component system chemotaxis response regulator CheB
LAGHDLIAIGGSAGGVEALLRLVPTLPNDLPAAVLVTLHLPSGSFSNLPKLLSAKRPLPAHAARDGEPPARGHIHVARPDRHLELEDGRMRLTRGPRENGHRPAVDALFRSAAKARGPRVVGVVLSGALDDGAAGLFAIRRGGGLAVVQDPKDALYPSMPRSALREAGADHVVRAHEMGPLLAGLAGLAPAGEVPRHATAGRDRHSPFSCPDCGGVLDFMSGEPMRLECQVGHRWTARSLVDGQHDELEAALWAAYRTLVEHARLLLAMSERARARGTVKTAERYAARAEENEQRARLVRAALGFPARPDERASSEAEVAEADIDEQRGGNGVPKG